MTSVRDIIFVVILLFVVGMSVMFMVKIGHNINTQLLNVTTFNNSVDASDVIRNTDNAINSMDYIFLAFFIAFCIGVMIFGYNVGGTPIIAPIYFFILIIFAFIGVLLQLAWADIGGSASLIATTSDLPITNFILTHLGYFTVVIGLLGIISMYAKPPDNYGY